MESTIRITIPIPGARSRVRLSGREQHVASALPRATPYEHYLRVADTLVCAEKTQ